jgi:hypothetical protein
MSTTPKLSPSVLPLDRESTTRVSQGQALETPEPGTGRTTMNLQIQGGTLPVHVAFVTPWEKAPTPTYVAGFQLNNVKDLRIDYDPSVDPYVLKSGQTVWQTIAPGSWIVVSSATTGGIVGVYRIPTANIPDPMVIPIGATGLQRMPSNIDAPPDAFNAVSLQRSPAPILVNFAGDATSISMGQSPKFVVVHEQYWQLGGVTCSLAPQEKRSLSFLRTVGRLDSTTSQEQVQSSLSTSVSASASWGWGSLSASVSASLSSSSSTSQTTTITSTETTVVNQSVENRGTEPVTILEWQLVDRFTVVSTERPPAVMEAGQPATVMRLFPPHADVALTTL